MPYTKKEVIIAIENFQKNVPFVINREDYREAEYQCRSEYYNGFLQAHEDMTMDEFILAEEELGERAWSPEPTLVDEPRDIPEAEDYVKIYKGAL